MLANQIRPTTLSAAIVFRYIRFWPKKHRVLPFLAIAPKQMSAVRSRRGSSLVRHVKCITFQHRIFDAEKNIGRESGRFQRQVLHHIEHFSRFDFITLHFEAGNSGFYSYKILYKNLEFFDSHRRFRNALYGEKILLMGKCFVWAWFRQTTCICSSMYAGEIQKSNCLVKAGNSNVFFSYK